MRKKIVIGTRSSKLALWQAEYVADRLRKQYEGLEVSLRYFINGSVYSGGFSVMCCGRVKCAGE